MCRLYSELPLKVFGCTALFIFPKYFFPNWIPQQKSDGLSSSQGNSKLTPSDSFSFDLSNLDVPIATRKWVRSCTKHPIAKYLSHHKLSNHHKAFLSNIYNLHVPRTIQDALGDPDWKLAVKEEMNALEKNGTWEIVELPRGKTTVGCK